MDVRKVSEAEAQREAERDGAAPLGLVCPRCGCRDFRDDPGPTIRRTWRTLRTQKLPGKIRRYKRCRHCGRRITTIETIER